MKVSEQAAKESAIGSELRHGEYIPYVSGHIKGQQYQIDTLAEMAREHEKAIEDYLKKNCSNFGLGTSMGNSIRQSAHFGFTLGRASMQGEIDKITDFKNKYEQFMNDFNKSYQRERVVSRDLEIKLIQRDAEILRLTEMVEVMETSSKFYADKENWDGYESNDQTSIIYSDKYNETIGIEMVTYGGKNAKQALTKISEMRKKL